MKAAASFLKQHGRLELMLVGTQGGVLEGLVSLYLVTL